MPLLRPSHPRLDELGDFGDLVADFAALAAAGLWQVHVGSLPRTCSGLRLQKRAVLLAGGDHGGGLFNDTHRRIGSRIDEQTTSEFLRSFSHCFDLRCMLIGT